MGIISDIVEANKERIGQRLPGLPLTCIEALSRMLAMLACPICADLVRDESELQRHMLRAMDTTRFISSSMGVLSLKSRSSTSP